MGQRASAWQLDSANFLCLAGKLRPGAVVRTEFHARGAPDAAGTGHLIGNGCCQQRAAPLSRTSHVGRRSARQGLPGVISEERRGQRNYP